MDAGNTGGGGSEGPLLVHPCSVIKKIMDVISNIRYVISNVCRGYDIHTHSVEGKYSRKRC